MFTCKNAFQALIFGTHLIMNEKIKFLAFFSSIINHKFELSIFIYLFFILRILYIFMVLGYKT